jgi:hypothetical protein
MLCKHCENFDFDLLCSETGLKRHWQDLKASADLACELCQIVDNEAKLRFAPEQYSQASRMTAHIRLAAGGTCLQWRVDGVYGPPELQLQILTKKGIYQISLITIY